MAGTRGIALATGLLGPGAPALLDAAPQVGEPAAHLLGGAGHLRTGQRGLLGGTGDQVGLRGPAGEAGERDAVGGRLADLLGPAPALVVGRRAPRRVALAGLLALLRLALLGLLLGSLLLPGLVLALLRLGLVRRLARAGLAVEAGRTGTGTLRLVLPGPGLLVAGGTAVLAEPAGVGLLLPLAGGADGRGRQGHRLGPELLLGLLLDLLGGGLLLTDGLRTGRVRQHRLDQTEAERVARVDLAGLEARTGELRRRLLGRGLGLCVRRGGLLALGTLRQRALRQALAGPGTLRAALLRQATGRGPVLPAVRATAAGGLVGPAVLRLLGLAGAVRVGQFGAGARTLLGRTPGTGLLALALLGLLAAAGQRRAGAAAGVALLRAALRVALLLEPLLLVALRGSAAGAALLLGAGRRVLAQRLAGLPGRQAAGGTAGTAAGA
ncbi:hypothetical protein ACFRKE_14715, partial [Kitasatospora indigofera]